MNKQIKSKGLLYITHLINHGDVFVFARQTGIPMIALMYL